MFLDKSAAVYRFARKWFLCRRVMKNKWLAYGYLRSGKDPAIGHFQYDGLEFIARKEDWISVQEVLVENEYSCLDHLFADTDEPRIMDLGANIGAFGILCFSMRPSCHVLSVEAAYDTYEVLSRNKRVNARYKWRILNKGVWHHDNSILVDRRSVSISHRVSEINEEDSSLSLPIDDRIQGVTLQSLMELADWDHVDVIKMDIEGAEESVVPSSLDVLKKTRYLIVELHNDRIDAHRVLSVLDSVFAFNWRLNDRRSSKPLMVFSNEELSL